MPGNHLVIALTDPFELLDSIYTIYMIALTIAFIRKSVYTHEQWTAKQILKYHWLASAMDTIWERTDQNNSSHQNIYWSFKLIYTLELICGISDSMRYAFSIHFFFFFFFLILFTFDCSRPQKLMIAFVSIFSLELLSIHKIYERPWNRFYWHISFETIASPAALAEK